MSSGYLECAALIRVEDHYPMVYGYPVLLGLIICALSGVSLKWKTNSGATWNLLALTVVFVTWAVTAVVETLSLNGKYFEYFIRHCLLFFWWLFSIPIDGVTVKCNQSKLEAKAKYCDFSMQRSNFDGFSLKMSSILTSFTIGIQNQTS